MSDEPTPITVKTKQASAVSVNSVVSQKLVATEKSKTSVEISTPPLPQFILGEAPATPTSVTTCKQGPPGKDGIDGIDSPEYIHTQSVAASVWTINHNLGVTYPTTTVFSSGGLELEVEVVNISSNQCQVLFNSPVAGTARVI